MADKRRVMVEVRSSEEIATVSTAAAGRPEMGMESSMAPDLGPIEWDLSFAPVEIPEAGPEGMAHPSVGTADFSLQPVEGPTYIMRGEVDEEEMEALRREAETRDDILGVFADELIQAFPTCPGDPAVGSDSDVESLLCVQELHDNDMDGSGVLVAVVDTGVDMSYLTSKGKSPAFDPALSWAYDATQTPGSAPLGHGTMCAYDVCIAAPNCTLADIVLLRPQALTNLLSDAVRAYGHLLQQIRSNALFSTYRALVITNSWGMFRPTWDYPVGDPGNYSDNPAHPFNRIVATLARFGADILFAAGNCGPDCPDYRCGGVTTRTIYGANSHQDVLCIAGVDTNRNRVGYSSTGPGRLVNQKPDLSCYTHFSGSGVYPVDGGTSAATPVAAGVVAALRSRFRYDVARPVTHPSQLRQHVIDHCDRRGTVSHSAEYGWGIVDGCRLANADFPV